MELKEISPIEKVGNKKLKMSHSVSHTEIIIDATLAVRHFQCRTPYRRICNLVLTFNSLAILFLLASCSTSKHSISNNNQTEKKQNIELKNISPIEKVGSKKIKMSHWVSHTEIVIDATPQQVWSVLIDTESYPKWNEIILKMEGKIEDKGKVDVLFKAGPKAKPRLYHNTLFVEDGVEFYWSQVQAMGIKDRHCFRVEAVDGGKTKFIQSDQALGGMTWLIGKMAANIQMDAYPMFNRSLKAEVERRYPKSKI